MTTFSNMSMYSLTIQPPSATREAIVGDFMGNGRQQILEANGSRLAIYAVSRSHRVVQEVFSQDTFSIIRHLVKFRLAGGTKDMIAISTDAGRLVTYEYDRDQKRLETLHFETYGKSQIRRVIPGEYLAVDPKGRAIMIASIEKNKIVYILTRRGVKEITISSPLEAHKTQTLVYHLLGLDVGYDNPVFAALELDYSLSDADPTGYAYENAKKELVYYELDLGLNHIVRKWSEPVDRSSNILFRVPGGPSAPSGVLCCGVDNISYRRIFNQPSSVHRLAIPRREGKFEDPTRKRIIVAGTLYSLKGGDFFYLLQTEDGDVFKVNFDSTSQGTVRRIRIKYFDTIPVATSICILKAGFVYCASESGQRMLYELESLGDDSDDPQFESDQFPTDPTVPYDAPFFRPRKLTNLSAVATIPSMNPIVDMEVANLTEEDAPQIYTVSGTGALSTFQTTRNALDVVDLIDSGLPQQATGVWTTKLTVEDEHDTLIVLCLLSGTLVLKIGENVEEASNTGFILDNTTLGVQQWGLDCIIQIHPKGVRHISRLSFPDDNKEGAFDELTNWEAPAHRTVVAYAANNRQLAVALSSGDIIYFECNDDGSLMKGEDEINLEITITCLAFPEIPEGSLRAFWLAVGCSDASIRIYNTSPDTEGNILLNTSLQVVSAPPSSIAICYMKDNSMVGYSQYLHIGLRSGVYIRSDLDDRSGEIGATRRRFLGPAPVRFARVKANEEPAILAITTRAWLIYPNPVNNMFSTTPLNYQPFEAAWTFEGSAFKGVITVNGSDLRIFAFGDLSTNKSVGTIPLRYTPRKLVGYHEQQLYYVIETDNNTMDETLRQKIKAQSPEEDEDENGNEEYDKNDKDEDTSVNGDMTNGPSKGKLTAVNIGHPKMLHRLASCIQVVDPVRDKKVVFTTELNGNKCALSAALVVFDSIGNEVFLAVGTATDMVFGSPFKFKSASVDLYKLSNNGRSLELYHSTETEEPPFALLSFKGKLVAGLGRDLCIFDCGRKAILRKAATPNCTPTRITGIKTQGSRLVVSDSHQSVTYVVHKDLVHPNRLIPFVDDSVARHTTCADMLDYDTTIGGDKFGNLWVVRCPQKVSEASDETEDGQHLIQDKKYLGGTPNRLDIVAHYFTNDIPMAIQKTSLIAGGDKVVFWAGLQGTLGAMIPFASRRDFKMFQQLELLLRQHDKPISGRDHLAFRSYYTPIKGVIDGDLVERFLYLPRDTREMVVAQLPGNWSAHDVDDAIWKMRALYAF